jgi:hypothetical protein
MDRRKELGACLEKMKGWGGLTVDLLAAAFINDEAARRAFDTISTKARQSVSGRGVVVVYGTLAHGVPPSNVAGIICPLLDTKTNISWLGDTTVEGLKGGPILRVEDQNLDQFGWTSSLLTVYDFVVVQPASTPASDSSQPAIPTPWRGAAAAPSKRDEPTAGTVSYTCGKCGTQVYAGAAPSDATPERLAATALYCAQCDDIVCVRCGSSKMQKGGAVPCGKCGGLARSVEANNHPSWYPGNRPAGGNETQKPKSPTAQTPAAPIRPLLPAFSRDLTKVAMESPAEPTVVRENDLKRLVSILCRQVRSNPLLVGEATTVRRFIVEVLANRISEGDVPTFLQQKKILALDIPLLVAGSNGWSDFLRRLGCVAKEADTIEDVILLMENLPLFEVPPGHLSAAARVLKRALSSDRIRCIITTERPEIATLMKEDSSVGRYLEVLHVAPATKDECLKALSGIKDQYERFHALFYTDDALEAAVDLAGRECTGASLLDSAAHLLDRAGARMRVRRGPRPPEVAAIHARIRNLVQRMESAIANHEFDKARVCSDQERDERHNLRQLEEKYDVGDTVVVSSNEIHEAWASRDPVITGSTAEMPDPETP